jgi:hypothetical protein
MTNKESQSGGVPLKVVHGGPQFEGQWHQKYGRKPVLTNLGSVKIKL